MKKALAFRLPALIFTSRRRILLTSLCVTALLGLCLAAVTRRSALHLLLKQRGEETRSFGPLVPEAAENTIGGTYTTFNVSAAGTGALQGTVAFGMDALGDITGPYLDANRVAHGYLRLANGTITQFDVPGAGNKPPANLGDSGGGGLLLKNQGTIPVGINGGVVVGTYTDDNLAYHGFERAANGAISTFDVAGAITGTGSETYEEGTKAIGINTSGTIVGTYVDSNLLYHGFLRSAAGVLTKFDVPGAGSGPDGAGGTMPVAIDASGDVTGVYTGPDSDYHAFLRKASGAFVTFDPPDAKPNNIAEGDQYAGTIAFAINDAGVIAGTYVDANWVRHGFIRNANGTFTEFEAPGAGSAMTPFTSSTGLLEGTGAVAIDPAGDVAGMYLDVNLAYHAFVRYANGEISTFDAPGANITTLHGTGAFGINAAGDVAGTYVDSNFVAHGFLLTPDSTALPAFSVPAGTYTATQSVKMSDSTSGASIYYTLDGTTPTTASTRYSTAVSISKTTTLKAIAAASGFQNSTVATAAYTILMPQSIAFAQPASPVAFGIKPITLSATASSALPVSFSLVSGPAKLSGDVLTITGVGTVEVAASQPGNSAYAAAPQVTRSIVVDKAAQTIAFTQPTSPVIYGVKPVALTAKASSGLAVTFSVASGPAKLSGSTLTITGVGTVVVAANQAGSADYLAAPRVTRTIVVNKAAQTVALTQPTSPVIYGVKPIALTAKASSGLAVAFSVVSGPAKVSGSTLTITGAGTVVVAANQAGNADYAPAAKVSRTIVVNKAKLTVTANSLTIKQGAALPALTYTVAGFVNGDTQAKATTGQPVLSTTATAKSAPGTYPITIKAGTLAAPNYTFALVNGTLTVTP